MFWLATLMAVALIGSKAFYLDGPDARLGWIAAADVFYALVVGLAGETMLLATRRRPQVQRGVWGVLVVLCLVSVLYAIVSVKVFSYFRTSLNYSLLSLGGDLRGMRSSLIAFATPAFVAALVAVPVAYLVTVAVAHRRWRRPRARWIALATIAVAGWFAAARGHAGRAESLDEQRLAENPHYVLAASFVRDKLFDAGHEDLGIPFEANYAADFRIAAERRDAAGPTPKLVRGPRNVIVVVCESVGTQFLSLYGSSYKTWPRMQAEASHALVFDNYYANVTNTANALFSLTLSCYPPLRADEQTIKRAGARGTGAANVLRTRGYRTAFISAGYNDWANQDAFLASRGYDVVWDADDAGVPELNSWGVEDRCAIDMVLRYIDREPAHARPFYVFAWTQANHHPYGPEYGEPAKNWDNPDLLKGETKFGEYSWDLGRYMSALYELDKQLGRLFDELRARGLADDTIVVITGDHGEVFGWPHKAYGHGGGVYQEYVNVPFVVWSPALFKAPARAKQIGGHVDLQATVLDLLGVAPPAMWQGRSLLSPEHPPRAYFFGSADQGYLGVREGSWKYVYNRLTQGEMLFDLTADPTEQANVAAANPQTCHRLRQRIAAWADAQRAMWK
jgi:arylsulfatase A-like enzyme